MDAAVDTITSEAEAITTMKVVDSNDAPQSASLFTCQLSSLNPEFNGLKSHLVQNLIKKPKAPSGPLPPPAPLPSPLLCPHCTFLMSLILMSKFMEDQCYSNKAWVKLSGFPPFEIGHFKRTLGDAI
jgi:hypothetical protein